MRFALLFVLVGCWTDTKPTATPVAPNTPATDAAAVKTEGCQSAHDCKVRDVCGCSCEGVLLTAPKQVACEESCPNKNVCAGYSIICELSSHRCGALPPNP
jgi:hypothetical protein